MHFPTVLEARVVIDVVRDPSLHYPLVVFGVGTILAGKYRIERLLGEGGMGMVVAATHLHLGTQVALKFLLAEMVGNQNMAERFMREARASALLKSEHVCRVSDVGMLDNGAPYIVMELLTGQDLAAILRTHGPLGIATAADYMLQACTAIAEAHGAGIVHRDLKPGNLFWTQKPDGSTLIKVLDFGIAKAPGSSNFSMTQTSAVMGSPGYMSPEQLKSSKDVDARSDIWSLGCVLYELVTGRPPFHGESITELALRVVMDPTPQLPPAFPRPFEGVIARCLEKDPAKRYQNVAELAAGLAPFAGPRGAELASAVNRVLRGGNTVPVTEPMTRPPIATPTTLGTATGMVTGGSPRKRGAMIAAFAGIGIVGGIVAIALTMSGGKKDASKTVEPAAAPPNAASTTLTPTPTETPAPVTPPTTTPPATTATTPPAAATPTETPPATATATATSTETPPTTTTATTTTTKPAIDATKPATKPTTIKKKPTTTRKKKPEDVGDSRW